MKNVILKQRAHVFIKLVTVLALLLVEINTVAQNGSIIPPSPNMSTMQRFGDYPVNLSTGLVDITIPLYEIKLKDYSFPVSIKFHASGRRWDASYSSMGVGWSLDASGYVSREIRERPDENYLALEMTADSITNRSTSGIQKAYDRLLNADMSVPNGHLQGESSESQKEDPEHDMFTFGANGISGKFVVDKWGNAFPLTYNPYKINAKPGWSGCDITDEHGTVYTFGGAANSIETVYNATATNTGMSFITGTLLSRIERPSGESINFSYNQNRTNSPNSPTVDVLNYTGVELGDGEYNVGVNSQHCSECYMFVNNLQGRHEKDLTSYKSYDISTIKEITFANGKIVFDYDAQTFMLTGFHIVDSNNHEIRSGAFTYINTPGTPVGVFALSSSRSLGSLVIKTQTGATDQTYSFEYYNNPLPVNSYSAYFPITDWWGYCNASGLNFPNLPPADPAVDYGVSQVTASSKESNLLPVISGMLKKIYYPTGGSTEFDYELNQYNDGTSTPRNGPGLRIKQMVTDDGSGVNAITKIYKYGVNEDGKGYLYKQPDVRDFKYEKRYHVYNSVDPGVNFIYLGDYTIKSFFPFPIASMSEAYHQPVYYDKVAEYTLSQNGDKNGKTEYAFSLPQYLFTGVSLRKKEWTGGELLSKAIYSIDQSGTKHLVENISNGYGEFHYRKLPQVRIWRNSFLRLEDVENERLHERANVLNGESVISYYNLPYEAAIRKQIWTEHTVDNVTTTTQYYYDDPNYIIPTRVVNTASTGEQISEETQYVFDFVNPLNSMFQKNWLFPIETSTYRMNADGSNKRLISSELRTWSDTKGVPVKVYRIEPTLPLTNFLPAYLTAPSSTSIIKDRRYTEKYSFDQYGPYANLLQEHKTDDIYTSYLWDATYTYPMAQVKGATYAQITILNGKPANYNSVTLYNSIKAIVPSAIIQTYSYAPLVGMSSQTDSNGRTTYYGYDTYNRLETIKDHNLNIVKKFTYHYKQ